MWLGRKPWLEVYLFYQQVGVADDVVIPVHQQDFVVVHDAQ